MFIAIIELRKEQSKDWDYSNIKAVHLAPYTKPGFLFIRITIAKR